MTFAAHDCTVFRFSTANVPPQERIAMWHDVFGRSVSRRMLSLLSDTPCHVDMTVRNLARNGGGSGACVQHMVVTGGVRAQRTRELLSDGNDDIVLHLHETGRRSVSQLGREGTVEPGGAVVTSNSDVSTTILAEPTRFASIAVPRKVIRALAPGVEDALIRPLPPDAGVLRLLLSYLNVLEDEEMLKSPDLQRAAAAHIHDLCALVIGATCDAAQIANGRGLRAARLRAIKAEIEHDLEDGDVSATALAKRHHVTPRYIHKLFESEGATLSRFVLGRRLARVHRTLTDPRHRTLTIGTIAYGVGFGDLSTFNREFRHQYGATPSEVRAAAEHYARLAS
jgi:AraC-like DNA-binding protein